MDRLTRRQEKYYKKHPKLDTMILPLAKGVILQPESAMQKENRIFTLILKGILVYLIVMGCVGSFLSALEVEYNEWVVHISIVLISVFCATLYYHKVWENIGYILLLALMVFIGSEFRNYINSGFYALANVITEISSDYFGTEALRSYGEQVGNRYMAVTISMCYIGGISSILLNILISRKMKYALSLPVSLGVLIAPLYLELEPDGFYAAMLFAGITSAYIIRSNEHYKLAVNNNLYEYRLDKRKLFYVHAGAVFAEMMAAVFALCLLVILLISVIYPREKFQAAHSMSEWKESTMDTVENFSRLGMMGLFNFYPNTGGLTSGTLGGVSSVRLDFETDLTVEFAPYNEERLYLKTFTGAAYLPYQNRWSGLMDSYGQPVLEEDITYFKLKERYVTDLEDSAMGIMKITNVAAPVGQYMPYYSVSAERNLYPGGAVEYTYYPRVCMETLEGLEDVPSPQWLAVPEENLDAIKAFCEEAGLYPGYEDPMEAVEILARYYQEEIPYTLKPGLTPYRRDFINYFLTQNRKGYCAHFASAATLILRYLGIPAKYVEGYAIDAADIAEKGTILEDVQYTDYYDGYSPLGAAAVVSVDATDANAHAWVEVYDKELGWQVAEVTPYAEEDEQRESLWQRLMNFLTGNQEDDAEGEDETEEAGGLALDEQTRQAYEAALGILLLLLIAVFLGRYLAKKVRRLYRYFHADRSDKLILRYLEYIHKISKKNKGLTRMVNYQEQLAWLAAHGFWTDDYPKIMECIRILEKAGFSGTEISEEEFKTVMRNMNF